MSENQGKLNVLFCDVPMNQYFDGSTRKRPLKLLINDIFDLTKEEANNIAALLIQVSNEPPFELKVADNCLQSRRKKEPGKEFVKELDECPYDSLPDEKDLPESTYDFKFNTFGNYFQTFVTINATLHFRKLHLLFSLPGLILRAYWQRARNAIANDPDPKSKEHAQVHNLFENEKDDIAELDSITSDIDLTMNSFPHIIKKTQLYPVCAQSNFVPAVNIDTLSLSP